MSVARGASIEGGVSVVVWEWGGVGHADGSHAHGGERSGLKLGLGLGLG